MTLKVTVDPALCAGSGECIARAPGAFRMGPNRQAEVLEEIHEADEVVIDAGEACPYFAIRITRGEQEIVG